jgi:phage tail-like protein
MTAGAGLLPEVASAEDVRTLQRRVGNQAVVQLLSRPLQRKGGDGDGGASEVIGASSFVLEMGDDRVATFKEVSGLEQESEVREVTQSTRDGKPVVVKSQGAMALKPGKITGKYAAFTGDPILKWRQQVVDGKRSEARRNVSIVVYGAEDNEAMRFNLLNAWPSKYAWPTLSAKSNEALEVTVTIEHEGMTVA